MLRHIRLPMPCARSASRSIQIEKALQRFGVNTGVGFRSAGPRTPDPQYRPHFEPRRFKNTVVLGDGDKAVYLHQVADVGFAAKVKRGEAGFMGQRAVIVSVEKQPMSIPLR